MIPDPLLFTVALIDTGALLFLLVYFVSGSSSIIRPILILSFRSAGNNPVRCGSRLFECSTMLLKIEFLGRTKNSGPRIHSHCHHRNRTLLAVSVQYSDARLDVLRVFQFALGEYGRLRSNRNPQPWHDQEAFA